MIVAASTWARRSARASLPWDSSRAASVRGPGDNPHAESFFHTLKAELTRGVQFATEAALRTQLRRYMRYYNTKRLHSSLNYLSPLAFEQKAA